MSNTTLIHRRWTLLACANGFLAVMLVQWAQAEWVPGSAANGFVRSAALLGVYLWTCALSLVFIWISRRASRIPQRTYALSMSAMGGLLALLLPPLSLVLALALGLATGVVGWRSGAIGLIASWTIAVTTAYGALVAGVGALIGLAEALLIRKLDAGAGTAV